MNPKKPRAAKATQDDWLAPLDGDAPCGPDLEYDPEYVMLWAKATVQPDAQYGNFVGSSEPVNWSDIDRDCRRLMRRSKDIRLAVLFTRSRTRLAGASGLSEGLGVLANWLDRYPDALHPQLAVDSDRDAALEMRTNAIQGLADADGLLTDVREIKLARSTAVRLQVRDVERAFARPRPADALAPESVARQLDDLAVHTPDALSGFAQALTHLEAIEAWATRQLAPFAPDLGVLSRLLRLLVRPSAELLVDEVSVDMSTTNLGASADLSAGESVATTASADDRNSIRYTAGMSARTSACTSIADRRSALDKIREARSWFEAHEPSSPIPVFLKRAEQCVGKRYADVVQAIPSDLLAQWEAEGKTDG